MSAETTENVNQSDATDEVAVKAQELEQRAEQAVELAETFDIDSDAMYEAAGAELVELKKRMNEVEAKRKETKAPILEAAKRIDSLFKVPLERFRKAESIYKRSMQAYYNEQEAKRLEAQRQAEAEARKERERIEAERRAQREKEKAEADARETEVLEQAEKLAAAGKPDEADRLLEQHELEARHVAATVEPETVPTVPAVQVPEKPKAAGVSYRDNYKAEVVDLDALLCAIVEGQAPKSLIKIDQAKLNQLAKSLRDELRYPGVKVTNERVVAAGGC